MDAWWATLTILQQIMFVIGCATTLFLIVQVVMMLIGAGGGLDADAPDVSGFDGDLTAVDGDLSGADADLDSATPDVPSGADGGSVQGVGFTLFGLKIFSVRSVLAFFSIGAWVAFTVSFSKIHWAFALLLGVLAGFLAALAMAAIVKAMYKLACSGNIDVNNCVGLIGEVYLVVPAARSGEGKVNVTVQERFAEFSAVTDCKTPLPTGTKIKITGTSDENVVVVEPDTDVTTPSAASKND